jgi:hypothetical protein
VPSARRRSAAQSSRERGLQRDRGVLDRIEPAAQQTKPFAHLHVLFRRPRNEGMPARLAAEAQAPMPVADKAKLSPAVGTTIL